jgi:diketogulonate reductase-like aldo/keto reductase
MGEDRKQRRSEIAALRLGLDLGATLIDTAEMYAEGAAEEIVGEAIAGRRDEVFLVSKVYPHNATRDGTVAACKRSLQRLQTDRLDLYLLHWPGSVPIEETLQGFMALRDTGLIRHYGVSNFALDEMEEVQSAPGGKAVATDQVLYNFARRGIELDLLPWLRKRKIPIMAYSPLDQGRLIHEPKLVEFGRSNRMTPAQVALAWLLAHDDVIVIPKSSSPARLNENLAAFDHSLNRAQLTELDRLFPAPREPQPLEML